MNNDFPRILTLLRKERGISQKQAAAQLGVSQALLSHYEKGIRECGLDFVVRVAEFYGVSCDYLLGRSPDPGRKEPAPPDIPTVSEDEDRHGALLSAMRMLLSMTDRIGSEKLSGYVESFLKAAVYRMFRQVYRVNPRNEESLFTVPAPRADLRAAQQMEEAVTETEILSQDLCGERLLTAGQREQAALTTELLTSLYGEDGSEMLRLIHEQEEKLKR